MPCGIIIGCESGGPFPRGLGPDDDDDDDEPKLRERRTAPAQPRLVPRAWLPERLVERLVERPRACNRTTFGAEPSPAGTHPRPRWPGAGLGAAAVVTAAALAACAEATAASALLALRWAARAVAAGFSARSPFR